MSFLCECLQKRNQGFTINEDFKNSISLFSNPNVDFKLNSGLLSKEFRVDFGAW